MSSRAVAQLRRCRAVELVSEGKTYDQVAKEVRYSNRGTPHRVVSQALSLRLVEDVDILRQLEADRVDALQLILWPLMESGDVAAANTIGRIIAARVRLLGLDEVNRQRRVHPTGDAAKGSAGKGNGMITLETSWPEVLGHTHRCEVFVNDWQRGGAAAPALVIVPGPALASVPAAMTMDCTA